MKHLLQVDITIFSIKNFKNFLFYIQKDDECQCTPSTRRI